MVTPTDPNGRTELELALIESENVRTESESLRELVAKLLADSEHDGSAALRND